MHHNSPSFPTSHWQEMVKVPTTVCILTVSARTQSPGEEIMQCMEKKTQTSKSVEERHALFAKLEPVSAYMLLILALIFTSGAYNHPMRL